MTQPHPSENNPSGRLAGKVAFLTGAGAGIGRATAELFAREGARVVIAEIDRDTGLATEQAVRAAGGDALFIETDVTQDDGVRAAIDATVAHYGALDVLFNCAGGSSMEDQMVHEMRLDVWERTVALNLLHPILCCRHALPHMLRAGRGSIINVSSHTGLVGSMRPLYSATKGGVNAFTRVLAAQYSTHGIRANAIASGTVRSERSLRRHAPGGTAASDAGAAERAAVHKLYPWSVGDPGDMAAVALFLASDESRMVNGTTLAADGGRSSYLRVSAGPG